MTPRMRDDEFEAVLGRALRPEVAPAGLKERILGSTRARQPHWLMVMLSPARITACAGVLSLLMGFALGASNAVMADDFDGDLTVAVYADADLGGF
jgi:hypothetical protein